MEANASPTSPRGIMPLPAASRRRLRRAPQPAALLPAIATSGLGHLQILSAVGCAQDWQEARASLLAEH